MKRSALIELCNYSFTLGARKILSDISLTIEAGEFICLIGPNGAGKTTLIKSLNRIYRGGHGEIFISGKPSGRYSQSELARWMAYVPQADGRAVPFTVHQFVMMGRYPYCGPFSFERGDDADMVRWALDITGTSVFAHRFVDTLSGGERQKVFLAAALAQQARILLLDEPTTFLDPRHQIEINRTLRTVNEEGITILKATHDVNASLRSAKRILALRDGRLFFDGRPAELARSEVLRKLYDQDFLISEDPQIGHPMIVPVES